MNKSSYIVIVLLTTLAIGLPLLNEASAATYVSNLPNGSGTWTSTNSPYYLTSNLVINNGETLNIQSGVMVHLNGYQIQVYGTLNAQGSNNNEIYFSNDGNSNSQIIFTPSSSSTCTIDYAVFYSVPITIDGGASTIRILDSYFTSTSSNALITVNSGFVSIKSNIFSGQNSQDGIHINNGYVTITSNTISGANYGIYNTGSLAPITSNTITSCFSGIYTSMEIAIQNNVIAYNTNDGIVTQTATVSILNNAISFNKVGISRDANIQNNTLFHNTYALWGQTSGSKIHYNNILESTTENVHLTETAVDVDATYNWWGTTDEASISQTISDYKVHSNLGNLTFTPFLSQSADALAVPTSIVVPTPPPTPTTTPLTTATPITSTTSPTPIIVTPSNAPYPSETAPSTPTMTPQPLQSSDTTEFGGFSATDVTTAVVIVVAVCVTITIIAVINRSFGHDKK